MQTTITLTIHHKKPIADLTDKVAGRAYALDGVDDVTAELRETDSIDQLMDGCDQCCGTGKIKVYGKEESWEEVCIHCYDPLEAPKEQQ